MKKYIRYGDLEVEWEVKILTQKEMEEVEKEFIEETLKETRRNDFTQEEWDLYLFFIKHLKLRNADRKFDKDFIKSLLFLNKEKSIDFFRNKEILEYHWKYVVHSTIIGPCYREYTFLDEKGNEVKKSLETGNLLGKYIKDKAIEIEWRLPEKLIFNLNKIQNKFTNLINKEFDYSNMYTDPVKVE